MTNRPRPSFDAALNLWNPWFWAGVGINMALCSAAFLLSAAEG